MILGTLTLAAVSACAGVAFPSPVPSKRPIAPIVHRRVEIYSVHARHRLQALLRLRLLELHEANLDRARAVVEHRLDLKDLLDPPAPAR